MYLTREEAAKLPPNPELDKIMELISLLKEEEVFSFEGVMFKGNMVEAVKTYVKRKPSKKFFIWLQDNYTILHEGENK
jgi:hypothetical protein